MDSDSSNQMPNPKRLKTLASEVRYPLGNNILHQFVLDNSDPNNSVSQNCINAVLLAMNGSAVDVNALNDDGYSPLKLAIKMNNLLMVKKLLSCLVNIDVNARCDEYDESSIIFAVELRHFSIIEELLNKGADANIKDAFQNTALFFAVRSGNLDIVKLLVSKGANVERINRGRGALHCAARSGNIEIVKYLVGQGADINAIDRSGSTPFHDAAESGNLDIIKFLLDRGLNANIESESGGGLLLCAAELGDLGAIQLLIGKGADVNAKDKDYKTPLHHAMLSNNEVIRFLVEKGANVNATDLNVQTPLHHLLDMLKYTQDPYYYNETDNGSDNELDKINIDLMTIKLLLEANADVNIEDKFGNTPLRYAVDFTNSDILKLFLKKEVHLNAKYIDGNTLLHHACKCDDKLDIIVMLLTKGCDVNAKNGIGRTPLHGAVCRNNAAYTQLLLERGASVHVADVHGWTPLHIAAYYGYVVAVKVLLVNGADTNAINKYGETPLDLAKENNHHLCIDALQ